MAQKPFFSVILPTYRRHDPMACFLKALNNNTYPAERFEVIVVDDDNNSHTKEILASLKLSFLPQLMTQEHAGPAAARNIGRSLAKGKYLVFIDDDCLPEPEWLTALAQISAEEPGQAIVGRTVNGLPQNIFARASQALYDYLHQTYNLDGESARFGLTCNLAVPADGFDQLGGFDTSFTTAAGEDRDFCARWQEHGLSMVHAPEAVVQHHHALTFGSFCRQHFNYGRGAWIFHQKRPNANNPKNSLEPMNFYLKLIFSPLSRPNTPQPLLLVPLLLLSQLATCAGYLTEKLQWT